ncbi:large ribosomal subunit protein bL35 [endosymbiont GvMRE of Glomus versiforme]|uniref:large ribosomal subunit protein bL35 n=1 Tax=endosymbiont GvMRE of Glomus versiforme TaxID=2039283 RepID=UPI000EE05FD3|nr:50S ribosomal protein L35 [endosymbiont GvMRE of Glomus versiforme]RHZ35606.1 50S ribosomal protein L35 [endosymbiont GvMRE of Glomus versiforme]
MSVEKLRSKKSFTKRLRFLSKGRLIKHRHACTSHLAYSKSAKQKRHLRKHSLLNARDKKRIKNMVPYLNTSRHNY